jgi:cyclic pyranopterin phosphate synthase
LPNGTDDRPGTRDVHQRPLRNLRVSVTDRCNLRCAYCMPEETYTWLPRRELLTFEEILRLVDVFTELGVNRVRLTGGEPLLRSDLHVLVGLLSEHSQLSDLALTTNAVLLGEQASRLQAAGLHRVTVSLDTLQPRRFQEFTRKREHGRVLEGIEVAAKAGFQALKINMVVVRDFNQDELADMLELGRRVGAQVRFIEYMDVGGATRWSPDKVVPRDEMLQVLGERYGTIRPVPREDTAPADRYILADGTVFGIIASTTAPFCGTCDRSRLTADGLWYRCLYAAHGINLREPLRDGSSAQDLTRLLGQAWAERNDRGAEERLELASRAPLLAPDELHSQPHREMHTRGG